MDITEMCTLLNARGHDSAIVDGILHITLHKHKEKCDDINSEALIIGRTVFENGYSGGIAWEVVEYDG